MELCRGLYEYGGAENARLGNAGPSRNASSLCYVSMVKRTIISSEGIGVILSCFFSEYAAIKDICGRFTLRSGVRPSVCLSVPSIDSCSGVRLVCCCAPARAADIDRYPARSACAEQQNAGEAASC